MMEDGARIFLLGAALVFVVGTLLPLLNHDHWTVRLFDFPRLQLSIGGGLVLGGLAYVGPSSWIDFVALFGLAAGLVYQIDHILPYTPLAAHQVQSAEDTARGKRISLLICNVEVENRDADRILEHIENTAPDLVLAVETDAWWIERFRSLQETYPHVVEQPQDNAYGMLLCSKYPLRDAQVRFLVEEHVPSIHARVELPAETVYVHCMHPRPPHPTHDPDTTERDAELLHLAREIQDRDAPTIVAGDLNDVSWSYTTHLFQRISGLLDPRVGRGIYSTFHARYPLFRYPLDHAFHSPHFKLVKLAILPYIGSDHFPVYTELQYEPTAPEEHAEPTADAADEAQAQQEFEKLHQKRANDEE